MNLSSEKNNGLPNEKRAVLRTALYIAGATAPCYMQLVIDILEGGTIV